MTNEFAFLGKARPASLYILLKQLSLEDAAIALAGMPPALSVQVMAFFPEKSQAELMPAMREARSADAARTGEVVDGIRRLLLEAKKSQAEKNAPETNPAQDKRDKQDKPASSVASAKPENRYAPSPPPLAAKPDAVEKEAVPPVRKPADGMPAPIMQRGLGAYKPAPKQTPSDGKPVPWIPRAATASPINGPALPGKPQVSGDPFTSPLAKAGLLDLIGRAQEKFLPKGPRAGSAAPPPKNRRPGQAGGAKARPEPREGVASPRSVEVGKTPRVIGGDPTGLGAAREPGEGARNMDGKAILAAILRASGSEVRDNVLHDDPKLYRELKGRMFYFDDLIYTEDSGLAKVFTAAPAEESAIALKFAAPALRSRVLGVVSPGRAKALIDVPPVKGGFDAVERAQKKVLDVALQLQAAGRILIDPRDPDLAK